jgi:hypothetical protein
MLGSSSSFSPTAAAGACQAAVCADPRAADAPANASLLYALLFSAFMFGIAGVMWRKNWFVKV